jgi:hypothetical protein
LTSGYKPGVFDLVWTDPSQLTLNSRFILVGVNIYRSFDSEFGPYDRINEFPIGSTFWRDQTDNVLILDEPVTDDRWLLRGPYTGSELDAPRYVFRTLRCPLVQPGSQALPANIRDVEVRVNGVVARLSRVIGPTGEIEVDPDSYPNVALQKRDPGIIPDPGTAVTVSYTYDRSLLRTDLLQRVFYRATAVGYLVDLNCTTEVTPILRETPLERAAVTSSVEVEKIDWIWREAVRRNRWILDQGGERVKVFIRKHVGEICGCTQTTTHKQPLNDCENCYGTSIVGGYEGPFDVVMAPDDAERKHSQRDTGRTIEHGYEVWTGPSPLLSQRDFVVKITGDRYSVGAVRMPTNRGMVLQQHFMLGHLDEKDIRYRVPIDLCNHVMSRYVDRLVPPLNSPAQITDKSNIPDEREIRGRTITWENIVW